MWHPHLVEKQPVRVFICALAKDALIAVCCQREACGTAESACNGNATFNLKERGRALKHAWLAAVSEAYTPRTVTIQGGTACRVLPAHAYAPSSLAMLTQSKMTSCGRSCWYSTRPSASHTSKPYTPTHTRPSSMEHGMDAVQDVTHADMSSSTWPTYHTECMAPNLETHFAYMHMLQRHAQATHGCLASELAHACPLCIARIHRKQPPVISNRC